jgi:hypothetical protein
VSIHENATEFFGLTIKDFDGSDDWNGSNLAYRIRIDWDSSSEDFQKRLTQLAELPEVSKLTALVIGSWSSDGPSSSEEVIQQLIQLKNRFTGLKAIFFGDIQMEECEISWIEQSDMSPLLSAYPNLETFRVRGGTGLSFSPISHTTLKELIVETGGLPRSAVREIFRCELPNLEHLEVWLGSAGYGWDGGPEDLQPLLSGRLFPKLRYLGIRNSEAIDDLTPVIVNSPILQRIKVLDLSLGNMSDVGGNALLSLGKECSLERLNLSHHYLSEELVQKIQKLLPCEVIADDANEPDDEWRSIFVSE